MDKVRQFRLLFLSILVVTIPHFCCKTATAQQQIRLLSGYYYSQGTLFNNSYRQVLIQNSRICIKFVDGPPNNTRGQEEITISTVSSARGKLYVDATNRELEVLTRQSSHQFSEYVDETTKVAFVDFSSRGAIWQLRRSEPDPRTTAQQNKWMQDCIKSQGRYVFRTKGAVIPGVF